MTNLFEDYREIDNVREKLDFLIQLVTSAPRRVFITRQGEVLAVLIGPKDYEDLWQIELDRDIELTDEEVARGDLMPNEEVMRRSEELLARLREQG